ncbi:MAG TPA: aspartate 1-decarboxylase [Candidatus Marinimicrobia bacterium]|jgi:aspartate 1-decarboxylase|nr:aspartate 1-decarboxylase [Candidatus Neomarinimicrobiota bacterium]MEE1506655.1 aspartate 1-decarboxylase [Candidatus Neomarinimicrobiota bacterium]MEE1572797.1 aspartate 1-decarboxylase [Candidatus Neomarinimicrobiota bacterium]HJL79065.1 aspartate 1-decarboxylase [Candidatus Neomarinimicrobiota bacterium]HJN68407.1 aspartate 1-decarboxylase [Candidatus Neomarinimicrobiota bacterium]|tara:strand:- start:3521 stop:3886 length:366 start_codon:yes stop_codon:yes gene_type:complete
MQLTLLKSKIHRATVTDADLHYEGSVSIDPDLISAAGLQLFEKVDIYNINTGERISTYVIKGNRPGEVGVNGAAARRTQPGDLIIIASYVFCSEEEAEGHQPMLVFVDKKNQIQSVKNLKS